MDEPLTSKKEVVRITIRGDGSFSREPDGHWVSARDYDAAADEIDRLAAELGELRPTVHANKVQAEEIKRLTRERDEAQMQASIAGTESGAYWKGEDAGVRGAAGRWQESLEKPYPTPGVMNEPLESLYRRTEALRAERDRLRACSTGQAWCKFASEAARLRAALERIANQGACSPHDHSDPVMIAREALAGAADETTGERK